MDIRNQIEELARSARVLAPDRRQEFLDCIELDVRLLVLAKLATPAPARRWVIGKYRILKWLTLDALTETYLAESLDGGDVAGRRVKVVVCASRANADIERFCAMWKETSDILDDGIWKNSPYFVIEAERT